ncbi:MAG TPA: hypothetical protein VH619_10645, partial [Verrucomicrobiae bacterium]|nr:hypothetical protein [Verrucomicrobiae bacterium]
FVSRGAAQVVNKCLVETAHGHGRGIREIVDTDRLMAMVPHETQTAGQPPVMIWGLPEMLISNVTLDAVKITGGTKDCEIHLTSGLQIVNSQIPVSAGNYTFELYDAQVSLTNNVVSNNSVTLSGLTSNRVGNTLAFYNANASLVDPEALENGPLTLGGGIFTVSNSLALSSANTVNFALGSNAATVAVKGNLALGGTDNVLAGGGFTNGTYTLMTWTGALSGALPTLGATPPGFDYALATNSSRQLNLIVTTPLPGISANLTALGTNLSIGLSWPSNYLGWLLQMQTNDLGTNWIDCPGSTNMLQSNFSINPAIGALYSRLVYP